MPNKSLKELKEELEWYETTPFYIGRDGMPSLVMIFIGWPYALAYKIYKKYILKKKINELENKAKP